MADGYSPVLSQKLSGAYFTPEAVSRSLVAWAARSPSDRLLDPSCGDGQFLTAHRKCVGIEQNPESAHAAIERAPWALVHEGDFFTWARQTNERFECAAGNPPFIRYHSFKGETRRAALQLCERLGAKFNGLTSSWAPFLVATAGLLKPGGRMAFVVPAEIGHAPYASPLLEYLLSSFATVHVVAVRDKLFPTLSEDCWLLYVDGYGGKARYLGFTALDKFAPVAVSSTPQLRIDLEEWRSTWGRRLRPYILAASTRNIYTSVASEADSQRFGGFAKIGIGYVSGDNEFFHLRPSHAERLSIPISFLHPSLRSGRVMPQKVITKATVAAWVKNDDPFMLLRLGRNCELPNSVTRYLNSRAGREARLGYKCRNREPWYSVPDVQTPSFMMSYMSGRSVNLVRNAASVTCTNSVHSVNITKQDVAAKYLPNWSSSFVRLSCEIEGHALGGGMLKMEPREAARILFPSPNRLQKLDIDTLEEAIGTLQRWRHYVQ